MVQNVMVQPHEILADRGQEGKRTSQNLLQVLRLELWMSILVVLLHHLGDNNVVGPNARRHVPVAKQDGGVKVRVVGRDKVGIKEDVLNYLLSLLGTPNNLGLRVLGRISVKKCPDASHAPTGIVCSHRGARRPPCRPSCAPCPDQPPDRGVAGRLRCAGAPQRSARSPTGTSSRGRASAPRWTGSRRGR